MSSSGPWMVYGSPPLTVAVASKRAALRLARKYKRLGIRPTIYGPDGEKWSDHG